MSLIFNMQVTSVFCNLIGVISIAYSIKIYIDQARAVQLDQKETLKELKNRLEKLPSIQDIEKIQKQLKDTLDNQQIQLYYFKNINEDIKKLQEYCNHSVVLLTENQNKNINEVLKGITEFQQLPNYMKNFVDDLDFQVQNYSSQLTGKIEDLMEELEEQDGERTNSFNRMLREVKKYSDQKNEELVEKLDILGQQYSSFEKILSATVSQMTGMADKDFEIIRGLLNE